MLCWRLQCRHSCQYFVWTLFYFIFCFVLFHTHSVYCCKVNAHAKIFPTFLSVPCPQLQCWHSCHYICSPPNGVVRNVNHLSSLCWDLYVKNVRSRSYLRGSVASGVAVCTHSGAAVCTVHMYCTVHCTVISWSARALANVPSLYRVAVSQPIRNQLATSLTNQEPQFCGMTDGAFCGMTDGTTL